MLAHKSRMSGAFTILSRYTQDSGHLVQVTNDLPQLSMAPTHTNCGFTVPCPAPPGGFDTLSRGPTYLTDPTQIPGLEQKTLSHLLTFLSEQTVRPEAR